MATQRNVITVNIKLQIDGRTTTITDTSPIQMSGDRRRWRRQIEEHVAERAAFLAGRFGG